MVKVEMMECGYTCVQDKFCSKCDMKDTTGGDTEVRICNHPEGCNSHCTHWLEIQVQLILFWIVGLYGLKFKGFM